MLRCTVSFLSTAPVAGFRSLDRFRGVDASAFRSPEPHGRRHSGAVRFFSMRRENSWILLVDDEDPIRRAVGQFLLDKGYKVTTCADGRAALQLALSKRKEGIGPVPDCIISDIRMPGMDGLELLGSVRNNAEHSVLSHVPVVLLTARANVQDRIAGYDAGADAYLTKPFSPEELVAIVDNVIERSEDISIEREELHKTVGIEDLKKDLAEIKDLLLNKGGCGIGNGWVQQTNVFLSKDERNVLDLLSRGLITKEIAANTHLSPRRIEQLLTGMFRKTGVKNRTELVRWGVSTGNVE
ncbi:unnamed protein product [Pseudo-nitzschia multistriata]|uniref:Response regulatory domain-containing protein n=1 Tax=Pseudo-nitzschia multistriata TaxID=183589 RepID=A0A448ZAH2_9STRA|nr:unnamed protein product [Pseudo-nitzschia multistriata]